MSTIPAVSAVGTTDTIFMESIAHNKQYKSGVSCMPVQGTMRSDQQPELHMYETQPIIATATYLFGPLAVLQQMLPFLAVPSCQMAYCTSVASTATVYWCMI